MAEFKTIAAGAALGVAVDFATVVPIQQFMGQIPAFNMYDPQGNLIWGINIGEFVAIMLGAGVTLVGIRSGGAARDLGEGWLLGIGVLKLAEAFPYILKMLGIGKTTSVLAAGAPVTFRQEPQSLTYVKPEAMGLIV